MIRIDRKILFVSILLITSFLWVSAQIQHEHYFTDGALRADLVLAGNHEYSEIYLDELLREKYWAGNPQNLIDPFDYGEYKYLVKDEASGNVIYSRGFCTLFEEWQTTDEAEQMRKAFSQVITFPFPLKPVILEVLERDRYNVFRTRFSLHIDPADPYIRTTRTADHTVKKIIDNGDPADRLDIVFIAEGYTSSEKKKFFNDASRFSKYLFKTEPFRTLSRYLNIWAVASLSDESGTDLPGKSIWRNTILNSNFYTFKSERYLTTEDVKSVRDIAASVPYDVICILVNTEKYGGGGIYNHYAIASSDGPTSEKVFVHEFGHALGGLGDEYYSSSVAYDGFFRLDLEPWQPNLTTLVDFESKWKDMLNDTIPVPTPATEAYSDITGVFEGGGYTAKGIYRPAVNCRMKSNDTDQFCAVCIKAITEMILYHCGM